MPAVRVKRWSILLLVLLALSQTVSRAQDIHRAGLVIQFGDGNVITACVQFTSDTVTGAELLRLSGLDVIMDPSSGFGEAICKISAGDASDGCNFPLEDCFCHCQGVDCEYWAYYHLKNNAWEYSQLGASNWIVRDGDVEGWAWGPGSFGQGPSDVEPPVIPFDQICIPFTPTPTATPTAQPTATPTPTPLSPTPTPTSTVTPTQTPSPTPTPTPTLTPTLLPGVTPSPTPTPRPPITIDFLLLPEQILPGECAQLQWTVLNADDIFLNINGQEERIPPDSAREVCPTIDTTYTLIARRADAEASETRILSIQSTTASPTPTSVPNTIAPNPTTESSTPSAPETAPTTIPTQTIPSTSSAATPPSTAPTTTRPPTRAVEFQPIQRLTPTPEPSSPTNDRLFLVGGFLLILGVLIAAGAWALMRQSSS